MALVIPPGFAQAAVVLTLANDAEPMITTFGVDVGAAGGRYDDAATIIATAWTGPGAETGPHDHIAPSYSLASVKLYVGQDGGPPVVVEKATNIAGSGPASPHPPNTALLVRKRSGLAGREGTGRMYVPGYAEANSLDNGTIPTATLAVVQTAWTNFLANLIDPEPGTIPDPEFTLPMVILHTSPQLGVLPPPTPVTSLTVDARLATQRRRLRP